MANISAEHQKFIDTIKADFLHVGELLRQAVYYIQESSDYECPIIIASDEDTVLGEVVVESGAMGNSLTYYATFVDHLVKTKVLPASDLANFKALYYQHCKHNCCMLVIFEDTMNFLYVSYL